MHVPMNFDLDKITVNDLLNKFGEGKAIPGSGSAAALQAIINANLILTVIKLTLEPKREEKFGSVKGQMEDLKKRIESKFIPRLLELFHEDYQVFDSVVENRKARDQYRVSNEEGSSKKFLESKNKIKESLFLATLLTIEISKVAHELTRAGLYVFLNGYKAVRGDSAVAIQGSMSMMAGSLHIAELNLKSLVDHEDFKDLELELMKVRSDYKKASIEVRRILKQLENGFVKKKESYDRIEKIFNNASIGEIEKTVRALQWELYSDSNEKNFNSVSDPRRALAWLGFELVTVPSLGAFDDFDGRVEAAGEVDNVKKRVRISDKYSESIQRFTLAHELGHAILHNKSMAILHRDRALEFGVENIKRIPIEVQADKFAAFFLMPRNEMNNQFQKRFGSNHLQIDQDTSFALVGVGLVKLKKQYKNKRELSSYFASTTLFAGNSFSSLSKQFQVSVMAMAIRIEELKLIDFEAIGY